MSGEGLFDPLTLRGLALANRIVVSPMQQYMAEPDGLPTEFHHQHYGRLALGGAGLLFTEALAISPEARVTRADLGLWSDPQAEALAPVVEAILRFGGVPATQLIHAGRKGSVSRPWEGYGPLGSDQDTSGGEPWTTLAPSAEPANPGWHVPAALDEAGIATIVEQYRAATLRAARIGFRALDIHAAHGYLLHSFLSPLANRRQDRWGGDMEGRSRLCLLVVEAVRAVWPEDRPLFVRLSCLDDQPGGWTLENSVALARRLGAIGADVIDCSSGGLGERTTTRMVRRPEGYQVPYAERIREETGLRTMAVGLITTPAFADGVVREGRADLVAIGREALHNPHWPLQAARALGADPNFGRWPPSWGWWLDKRARAASAPEAVTPIPGLDPAGARS